MSRLLRSPKALALLALVAVAFVISLAGGALGNEFGGGFLGSPLAHIQLPRSRSQPNLSSWASRSPTRW